MFRTIGSSVAKRRAALEQGVVRQQNLDQIIQEFIQTTFGERARHLEVSATLEGGNLFIQTQNKTAANEIIFHSGPLYKFLKTRGIAYLRVVIR